MIIFGERLNFTQWIGVLLALGSLYLLSHSGKREGIYFRHNRGVLLVMLAAITGACCGLYDRHIMHSLQPMFVQSWYTLYQAVLMSITITILTIFKVKRQGSADPFHWSWAIPLISLFLSAADIAYLFALSDPDAMISVVSMIRRSSVLVSFICGAIIFHERNLKAKAFDLALIFIGAILLYIGSR
jgi:transporter family protein